MALGLFAFKDIIFILKLGDYMATFEHLFKVLSAENLNIFPVVDLQRDASMEGLSNGPTGTPGGACAPLA